MLGNMKGLSWFRLIALQLIIGGILVSVCAYFFRVPIEKVQKISQNQNYAEQAFGVPLAMTVQYPGLGSIMIDDPKELLRLKQTFYELVINGKSETIVQSSKFSLTGVMYFLDQEPVELAVNAKSFYFADDYVNSLNVSASIRKLQSVLIDKFLTETVISKAVTETNNAVFKLVNGQLIQLTNAETDNITTLLQNSARVIDYSPITELNYEPVAHYVIQLKDNPYLSNHWLHIDMYDNEYFVVYDLLDETNHRAYFIINSTK